MSSLTRSALIFPRQRVAAVITSEATGLKL
jgi:hypothetical protein